MITKQTRTTIWHSLLGVSRAKRYVDEMLRIHLRYKWTRKALTGIAGALAAYGLVNEDVVSTSSGGLLVLLAVLLDIFWQDKASILSSVSSDLSVILEKYRQLFSQVQADTVENQEAWRAHVVLIDLYNHANNRADIKPNEKIKKRTQREAYQHEQQNFMPQNSRRAIHV